MGSYAQERSHDGSDAGDRRELENSLGGAGRVLLARSPRAAFAGGTVGIARRGAKDARVPGAATFFGAVPSKARVGKGKGGSPAAA